MEEQVPLKLSVKTMATPSTKLHDWDGTELQFMQLDQQII